MSTRALIPMPLLYYSSVSSCGVGEGGKHQAKSRALAFGSLVSALCIIARAHLAQLSQVAVAL